MARVMFDKRQSPLRQGGPTGFTLVELLVVITIIAILASLITVAAVGAMRRARFTRIKTEVDQIAMAFDTYANDTAGGDYPPNAITDSNNTNNPINAVVINDFRRHFQRAFPSSKEPEFLILALVGIDQTANNYLSNDDGPLVGGMTAAEALVFWMTRFSDDPKYPISGVGGPSYIVNPSGDLPPNAQDPINDRRWVIPLEVARLAPRNDQGYFNDVDFEGRYLQYPDPRGQGVRRINLWRYNPPNSTQPFVYFDASRHQPTENGYVYDPPLDGFASNTVFALKVRATTAGTSSLRFANDGKVQVLHAGIDDNWGDFSQIKLDKNDNRMWDESEVASTLDYPTGPFTGELADTVVNFSEGNLEDSQP